MITGEDRYNGCWTKGKIFTADCNFQAQALSGGWLMIKRDDLLEYQGCTNLDGRFIRLFKMIAPKIDDLFDIPSSTAEINLRI